MKDFENARQVLEELEAINNPQSQLPRTRETDINGVTTERLVTAEELQELNYEDIISLCDLLGMSDIYLGGTNYGATDKQRNDDQAKD